MSYSDLMSLCSEAQRLSGPRDSNFRHRPDAYVTGHPLRTVFYSMRDRCRNPKRPSFADYGGRGIRVCDRWLLPDGEGFKKFVQDLGPRPVGASLERIDVNGNYSPENCRWANNTEQARNKRNSRRISFNGQTKVISAWAKELGFTHATIELRINKWGIEKALTTPRLDAVVEAAKVRKARTHCKRGHEFTEKNTYLLKDGRSCRMCRTLARREIRAEKKVA